MDPIERPKTSGEVLRLIRSVEQLSDADQDRILRIVRLLACVPTSVQQRTQRMLRELIDTQPDTILECVAGVDEVIEYLENEIASDAATAHERFALAVGTGRPN